MEKRKTLLLLAVLLSMVSIGVCAYSGDYDFRIVGNYYNVTDGGLILLWSEDGKIPEEVVYYSYNEGCGQKYCDSIQTLYLHYYNIDHISRCCSKVVGIACALHSTGSLFIPKTVTKIELNYPWSCNDIIVDEENPVYDSRDNSHALIETSTNTLLRASACTTIPSSVHSIASYAFQYLNIPSVTIPLTVENIGSEAFNGCKMKSLTLPEGWTNIDDELFVGCRDLETVGLPKTLISIGEDAFVCCGMTSIVIPENVTTIKGGAFFNCASLKSIVIPNSVTEIGESAFAYCHDLNSIYIGDGVETISDYAFRSCNSLDTLHLGENVKTIGRGAFDMGSYKTLYIPKSVESIGEMAFRSWGLSSIVVDKGNAVYDSRNNCNAIIETSSNTLLLGCKNTVIPADVTTIGESAFMFRRDLFSIVIPQSVDSIGKEAFSCCDSLSTVIVGMKEPVVIGENTFTNRANATLYVPIGCKEAYATADYWKEFKEIVEWEEANRLVPATLTVCRGAQGQMEVSMSNVEQIVGLQFDLQLPEGVALATDAEGKYVASLTDRKADHALSVLQVGDGLYRFVSVSMTNAPFAATEGPLVNVRLTVDEDVPVGGYEVKVTATELTTVGMEMINSVDGASLLTVREADMGDVNGDMKVSVTDVASIIGYILSDAPATFVKRAADVNGDNKVSVTDAVMVIGKILNEDNASGSRQTKRTEREPQ